MLPYRARAKEPLRLVLVFTGMLMLRPGHFSDDKVLNKRRESQSLLVVGLGIAGWAVLEPLHREMNRLAF